MIYGPYCDACGDDWSDHDEQGCHATHMTMGPADNMDVDEIECDCANDRLFTRAEVDSLVEEAIKDHDMEWQW